MNSSVEYYKKLERPIIFIGNPRSGTSVISEIVMRHKDLGFPSQHQNRFVSNTSFNYLRRLLDNRLWRIHGQKRQLNKVNFINKFPFKPWENYNMWNALVEEHIDFGRGFLIRTRAGSENVAFLRKFFNDIVKKQGKKRLAFKITGPSRIEYLTSIFPDAQFVRIIREPVPTISSLLHVDFWKNKSQNKLWWKGPYTEEELQWVEANKDDTVALTAFQIRKINDTTDEEVTRLNADILNVEYSEFIKTPEKVIADILEYTGLSKDHGCFNYFKKNTIYQQNKKDEEYFNAKDLNTIRKIFQVTQV